MYQVEDEPIETIHLYVVREGEKRPSLIPVIISVFTLSILIAIGILTPYTQPEQRTSLRVPAVLSFMKTFSTAIKIVPTGVKQYPATFAHGILTLSNGSAISQTLPTGFIMTATNGIQVTTDTAIFVPAATANGFGISTVSAHLLTSGTNMSTLSVNQVIGTSLFIRNLEPFTGGHPAYSVKYVTEQDKVQAINQARALLTEQVSGLHYPCHETVTETLSWRCQFIGYSVPPYMHVINVRLQGKEVLVTVWFTAHPRRIWVK